MTGEKTLTEYVVLKFPPANPGGTPSGLQMVGRAKGANPKQAISQIAEKEGSGQYVAVPARSWQPFTLTVETTPKVKFA